MTQKYICVVTRFRQREEEEQRGSKKDKLRREDETETERKMQVSAGAKRGIEGNRFRVPQTLGKKQQNLPHLTEGRKPC